MKITRPTIAVAQLAWLLAGPATAAPAPLGEGNFANSGKPQAQQDFQRGLKLLHNFEYDDAQDAFAAAEKADPGFAMAYWGDAMTYNHPIWAQQDLQAARNALAHLGPDPATRAAKAPTARERAYLAAVESLYGDGSKETRDLRYARAMEALHESYPDDIDATAFYALALLGTSHGGRDVGTYMRAAAVLEEVFPTHPHHPGVLHYMIHSYDDPQHAPLGMRAARLYDKVAEGAPHAVHMTSHIYIALGMWDEVISANARAMAAEDAKQAALHQPTYGCEHYNLWLFYGYLQERRAPEYQAVMQRCRAEAVQQLSKHPQPAFTWSSSVIDYAEMAMRLAVDTGQFEAAALPAIDAGSLQEARLNLAYAAAFAAHDASGVRRAVADADVAFAVLKTMPPGDEPGAVTEAIGQWSVMDTELHALALHADGNSKAAIAALRDVAARQSALPAEFGPPPAPKPPYELLGDWLLAANDAPGAVAAYQSALAASPGRTLALEGLVVAATKAGEPDIAAHATRALHRYPRSSGASGKRH